MYEQSAAYDPNNIAFKSFVDPAASYGYESQVNGNEQLSSEASNAMATYAAAPAGPYGGYVPLPYYNYDPNGYQYQMSADNEYMMPQMPESAMESDETQDTSLTELFSPLSDSLGSGITNLLPASTRQLVELARRSFGMFTTLLGATIFGGGVTTAMCYFTPLCTISFALPFIGLRSGVARVAESMNMGKAQTNQLLQATEMVETAIRKIQSMQKSGEIKSALKQTEPDAAIIEPSDKVITDEKKPAAKKADTKKAAAKKAWEIFKLQKKRGG